MSVNINTKPPLKKAPFQKDYQSVSGIDALYFFIKVDYLDYTNFFVNHLLKGHVESDNFILLNKDYSSQFTYYKNFGEIEKEKNTITDEGFSPLQEICRIGFKNLNERDNLESIQVQMNSTALQQMSIDDIILYFTALLNNFGLKPLKFQLSRTDLNTYVFDYSFDWLSYDFFSTKCKKSEPKYNGYQLETFYLGTRGNGLFLRVYDKLKQLNTLEYSEGNIKEYLIGLKYISKYKTMPNYKTLWNVEIELRREQLKLYRIDTLQDLNQSVNSLFKLLFSKSIRLLQEAKKMNSNDNRIPTHSVWNHIINEYDYNGFPVFEIDKEKLKEYKRDCVWLKNRLVDFLDEPKNNDLYLREKVQDFLLFLENYTNSKGV